MEKPLSVVTRVPATRAGGRLQWRCEQQVKEEGQEEARQEEARQDEARQEEALEDWSELLDEISVDFSDEITTDEDNKTGVQETTTTRAADIEVQIGKLKLGCLEVAWSFLDQEGDQLRIKDDDLDSSEGFQGKKLQCLALENDYNIDFRKKEGHQEDVSETYGLDSSGFSMEDWKMNRTFDKAIEGLRKLKEDPIVLVTKTPPLEEEMKLQKRQISDYEDDDTYVISPFSDSDALKTGRRSEATFISTSPESDEGIEVIWPIKDDERERTIAGKFFVLWKDIIADRQLKFAKACLFAGLNLKVGVFQRWKEFVRKQKAQRELQVREKQIQEETIKNYLAQKYQQRNICSKVFSSWLMLTKIQVQKKKLIFLQQEKESSKQKVDTFLESLGDFRKTNNDWIMQKVQKDRSNIVINLDIAKKIYGPLQKTDSLPQIVPDPPKQKVKSKLNKNVDQSTVLQKDIISAQRKKMREQWKLIEDLKEQKLRLEANRPATKPHMVRKIEKREPLEPILSVETPKAPTPPTEDLQDDPPVSEIAYSDDFEDCSSEAASIVPKTPELLKKVREREAERAAKRAEIKLFHEKKLAEERAAAAAKKDSEQRAEEEDRQRRRELWRQARREEADKDKRRLKEKERQIKLTELAREFHAHLIVKQFGLRPWLRLIINRKIKASLAGDMYNTKMKR